jgi:hypothetical protein
MNAAPRACALFAALCLGGSGLALAAGLSLDVSPGLWEISTSGSASGTPQIPPAVLAKMTPEQRVLAQALLLALVAQAKAPHVLRVCITPEQLRQGFDPDRMNHSGCRQSVQSSSPAHLDMHVECTGGSPLDGTVHVDAVDRRTVTGNVDLRAGPDGTGLTIRQSLHGRWLGAACGEVRPIG